MTLLKAPFRQEKDLLGYGDHAFGAVKGASAKTNRALGFWAHEPAKLCAEAQMKHLAPAPEKEKMLAAIEAEYEQVKAYLKSI